MKKFFFFIALAVCIFGFSISAQAQHIQDPHPKFLVYESDVQPPVTRFAQASQPIPAQANPYVSHSADFNFRFVQAQNPGSGTDTVIDVETDSTPAPEKPKGLWAWLKANWAVLIPAFVAFLETVFRLTPTNTDNSVLNFIKSILDWLIPNRRIGGGTH